ncbi:MAG: hypothetical protein LJE83_06935 [Gammaproteobacteria bacterium]|nr:hypothetical protein [Gammaproteobacteria bacterium]
MIFTKAKLLVLPIACVPVVVNADDFAGYVSLESFSYSEPMAVKAVVNDKWDATLHPGEVAFSTDRIEFGVAWQQWSLGVLRRYDYYYEFTPDTAYLKYSVENHQDLISGQQLDIYLSANMLIANGLSLGFTQTVHNASFAIKASYLRAKDLTSGWLAGNATVVADNDYDLNFDVDYYYSEDRLFDREVAAPDGNGFTLDFNIDWHLQNWDFNLDVKDLLARIYWKDAPRTIAVGNTDTKNYDENGFLIFDPAISGIETNQDYTQTLPRKIHFSTARHWDDYSMLFEFQDFEIKQFYSIGAGFDKNDNEHINVFYNITAQALKFDYRNQWLTFSVTSDQLQIDEARTFGLELAVAVSF